MKGSNSGRINFETHTRNASDNLRTQSVHELSGGLTPSGKHQIEPLISARNHSLQPGEKTPQSHKDLFNRNQNEQTEIGEPLSKDVKLNV